MNCFDISAILKHIKSRNANYSDAIDYLLFQHDESTGKKIKDEMGRSLLRDEFYMDGLNCNPMSFDKECSLTNTKFHKNKKSSEIKSHHYIISFDPDDKSECGLTGEKAQELCLNETAALIFRAAVSLRLHKPMMTCRDTVADWRLIYRVLLFISQYP